MLDRLSRLYDVARSFVYAKRTFRGYRPQRVTWRTVAAWLHPYSPGDRRLLHKLMLSVRYFSDQETAAALVSANKRILDQLAADGLGLENVLYVQVHDAGSSSGVMLNLLRDTAKLERSGCQFLDANSRELSEITRSLGEGAIIYVDDFAGSGKQFRRVHRTISPYVIGRFVEFFLAVSVAEEAIERITDEGVEVVSQEIHYKNSRPLNNDSTSVSHGERLRLLELSQSMYSKPGLGFDKLCTMVVFARQCPNSVPLLLRGSEQQAPYRGLLPRTTDLDTEYLSPQRLTR